jgi:uncharacterized protein YjiS (DUF1127 family)
MTDTTYTNLILGQPSFWQRWSDLKVSLAERRAQRQAFRETVSQLSAMSDRDLTDIGIHRADIRAIAQEAAYRV